MSTPGRPVGRAGDSDDPQLDVMRIRLSNPAKATALLGELPSADRVVFEWGRHAGWSPVDFEITFFDGRVMRGRFEAAGRKFRCAFSSHVKRLLAAQAGEPGRGFCERGPCAQAGARLPSTALAAT